MNRAFLGRLNPIEGGRNTARVLAAKRVLTDIPGLLHHGYAHLEWLAEPVGED